MFVSALVYAALVFSLLSFLVAIPSAESFRAAVFHGIDQLPHAHALCVWIHGFHDGRPDRLIPGDAGIDVHVTDTYFVVAHFHYIMVGRRL